MSAYLDRPRRSLAEAQADIARAQARREAALANYRHAASRDDLAEGKAAGAFPGGACPGPSRERLSRRQAALIMLVLAPAAWGFLFYVLSLLIG